MYPEEKNPMKEQKSECGTFWSAETKLALRYVRTQMRYLAVNVFKEINFSKNDWIKSYIELIN